MEPFNQLKENPENFYLSIAVVCGLGAIGAAMASLGALAIVAAAGAVFFWRKSSASKP